MATERSLTEARWQAILTAAQDAIICIDRAGVVTLFNPAAERIFGYSAVEVMGKDVKLLMPSPYSEEHGAYLRRYQKTGEAKAIGRVRDVRAKKRDGTVFPIELSVSEVFGGEEVTYAAIVRDVSERRNMEELLRAERDFVDNLIETAHVIVLVLDTEGRVVRYNRHLEEVAGYRFEDVRQEDWFATFIPDRDRQRIRGVFEAALNGAEVQGNVNSIVTKSGRERQIQWYAKRLLDPAGAVIGVVSIGHDVTERLAAQERLRELEHAARQTDRLADIGAITTKVVHDLGNPLAALTMQAQLIIRRAKRRDFEPAELVERPVEQMLETLHRLEVLVREFTEFSREQRMRISPVSPAAYLLNVVELWEAYATSHGVSLRASVEEGLPEIQIDPEMFRRVLDNVLKNAIDATENGAGEVVLRARRLGDNRIRFSIFDDGCGIPNDLDVFRLFETTKTEGTGIGLAIAKQIVLSHNGEIHYENCSPKGTVFHIDIPIGGPTIL